MEQTKKDYKAKKIFLFKKLCLIYNINKENIKPFTKNDNINFKFCKNHKNIFIYINKIIIQNRN